MKMAKRETPKQPADKGEPKSPGTAWAEQTRAKCTKITTEEREKLLDRAMQIAYGAENSPATTRRR